MGKKLFNKKSFSFGKKTNFSSVRKGNVVGEHEVKFSNGKEIVTLNHGLLIEHYTLRVL